MRYYDNADWSPLAFLRKKERTTKMVEKRRDKKNRILREGEYQDKDGRYSYRYIDLNGKKKVVYSWRLVETDPQPPGTRKSKSLREMEQEISEKISDGIDIAAADRTLNDCFEMYMETRLDLKRGTREVYMRAYNVHVREELGRMKVAKITYSHIRTLYVSLLYTKKLKKATVEIVNALLEGIFATQQRDLAIRTNPTVGVFKEIIESNESMGKPKEALTIEQQEKFVEFYTSHEKYAAYVPILTVLLGTGVRIGECLALTWDDIDWENNEILIRRKYMAGAEDGNKVEYISSPKTKSGFRNIPMLSDVRRILEQEYKRQKKSGFCTQVIDGCTHFIFFSSRKTVVSRPAVKYRLDTIVADYNKMETESAIEEGRKPELLPEITPHTLRHCFCSRMIEAGVGIKDVQEMMGHSSYQTTMDVYTQISPSIKKQSIQKAEGKFRIL